MRDGIHSGALVQFALNHCSDAVYVLGPDGRVVFVNEVFCRMLGYTEEEALGLSFLDIDSNMDEGKWSVLWCGIREKGSSVFEAPHRNKDGNDIRVELKIVHARHEGQEYGCALARDFRERHPEQEALLRAKEEWEQTFDTVPNPLCVLDEDYRIIRMNEAMAKRIGMRAEEAVGRRCFECVHGTNEPPDNCPNKQTLLDGKTREEDVWIERLQGWFTISTAPIGRSGDGPRRTVHTMHDQTERKRAEEIRRELERHAQETEHMESLGVLAAGIAHDFNNILSGVLGFANLAMSETPADSPVRGFLGHIENGVQRATALCRQMLAYAGESNFDIRPIDLNGLIEELESSLRTSIAQTAELRLILGKDLPPCEGDFSQLGLAILHLSLNASEALENKPGVITIRTSSVYADRAYLSQMPFGLTLPEGRYASIEVADTGCGIAPNAIPRVFEPFFSTKFIGRGLGLSAVLGVVRSHRGTLKVYSEPGKGSCIKVLLPAFSAGDDTSLEVADLETDRAASMGPIDKTILLVDDEEVLRTVGERVLQHLGCRVFTACDGREALAAFQQLAGKIDGVVMDVVMPNMDGVEAFHAIRAIDPTVPILLTSGYSFGNLRAELAGKGLSGFIPKPYRTDTLRQALYQAFYP